MYFKNCLAVFAVFVWFLNQIYRLATGRDRSLGAVSGVRFCAAPDKIFCGALKNNPHFSIVKTEKIRFIFSFS